ncbi:MAG TPA: GtrA family protein [Candidatus Mucispirillum faecigallinarum]|uniref:GtrA family protein n=1 Tax=Candidatus Mucispirillum faecigallinarum TaxID=2838699 RepID=A0A9D2GWY7_9BACT|nr:GtrA family protein [Candidatus Mucispirillum faecigallinarum]
MITKIYYKTKEYIIKKRIIIYGICGIGTTIINIVLYQLLLYFNVDYKIANLYAVVVTKLLSYITNKIFVFQSKTSSIIELVKEFGRFIITKGFTTLIDYFGVIILVELIHTSEVYAKYIILFFIIILNFIMGDKFIFKHKKGVRE